MPAGQDPLSARDVETLKRWIEEGAIWDAEVAGEAAKPSWWSFRKPRLPPLPRVQNKTWAQNPIDAFVLAELEENGLTPAPLAPKLTLLCRAKFDRCQRGGSSSDPGLIQLFLCTTGQGVGIPDLTGLSRRGFSPAEVASPDSRSPSVVGY